MVDVARYFIEFLKDESCGQCNPCREGLKQMLDVLTRICHGHGQEGDIELLEELSDMVANASLCGLGTSAPNPVMSNIRYFREEYETHIRDTKCPAGVCKPLFYYEIDPELCTGTFGKSSALPFPAPYSDTIQDRKGTVQAVYRYRTLCRQPPEKNIQEPVLPWDSCSPG